VEEQQTFPDTFVRDLITALAGYLGPWLPVGVGRPRLLDLPGLLERAEQGSSGEVSRAWGRAARLADSASWLQPDTETARELWTEVRQLCAEAHQVTPR